MQEHLIKLNIKQEDIQGELVFGASLDTEYIFGMVKMEKGVKILVDIDKVLTTDELTLIRKAV